MPHTRRDFTLAAVATATAAFRPRAAAAAAVSPEPIARRLSDAFLELFGNHPGFREIHAKGIVCEATFDPSAAARSISRAPHFTRAVSATVRFSDFAGIPTIPSADPNASPHGLAVKFHIGNDDTDIVAHSVDAFPGATGEEFLGFVKALAKSPPGTPHPSPIERYVAAHPSAKRFVETMPPPPVSYATSAYHAINAFAFTNARGEREFGRYHFAPAAGVVALDPALVASRPRDYLADELTARLRRQPASFALLVQVAGPGDPTNDGTKRWPAHRRVVTMGTLTIVRPVADSVAAQRRLLYDPTRLIDGIDLSDDPVPRVRSATYAISYARRSRT